MEKLATKSALKLSNATNVQLQLEHGRPTSKPAPTITPKMKELELSVEKMKISSALAQTTPGGDDKLGSVHPAATIFRDHLLRGVVEENDRMKKEVLRLSPARDFLGSVKIVTKSGRVLASTSLDTSGIGKSCTGCDCRASSLAVPFDDFNPLPLADYYGARITMAGRDVAFFPDESLRVDYLDGEPSDQKGYFHMAFIVGGRGPVFVGGLVRGASEDDIVHLKNTSEKQRRITAEQSRSFTFVPRDVQMFIDDDLRAIIRAFGPRPMYDVDEPLESEDGKQRYAFLSDWRVETLKRSIEDEAIRSIVESLGGEESRMAVLNENEALKNERFRHELAVQLLGTVEISHPQGKIKLSLRDGELSTGPHGLFWDMLVEQGDACCNTTLNDLAALTCIVSGVRLERRSFRAERDANGDLAVALFFQCGTQVVGYVDEEAIEGGGLDTEEVVDVLRRVFGGEQAFPSTYHLEIEQVYFPLGKVQNALSVLGVEYEKAAGSYKTVY